MGFETVLRGLASKLFLAEGVGLLLCLCVRSDQLLLELRDASVHLRVLLGGLRLFGAGPLLQPVDLACVALPLRAQHLRVLAVGLALGPAAQLLLVFEHAVVLLGLRDLLLKRLDQHVPMLDVLLRGVLFRGGLVGLGLLTLTSKLKLLQLLCLGLVTEISPLQVRFQLPLSARNFLAVASELDELLVLLVLREISLAPQLRVVGEQLARLSLRLVEVTTQSSDQLPVPAVVRLGLERLVFNQQVRGVAAGLFFAVEDLFLKLMSLGL